MSGGNRVAVVTGAARGLGLETCRELSERGLEVVLTAREQSAVDSGLAALGRRKNVAGRILDVSNDASVAGFFEWLLREKGRIDVLVNNAGRTYGGWRQGFTETEAETILEAVSNNALSAWRTIRHALPVMNRAGYGRIVNVSSGMGQLSDMKGGAQPYRISKTALNAVTRIAAADASGNVKINSVCPGWVRTDMGSSAATRSVEEGAAGIVWAALLPDSGPSGGFFRDGKPLAW